MKGLLAKLTELLTKFQTSFQNKFKGERGRHVRPIIVGVVGCVVLLIGIAMLILPGPAVVFIPMGLAILAIEFEWARRLLQKVKGLFHKRKKADAPGAPQSTPK